MSNELWRREVRARKHDDDGDNVARPPGGDTVTERRTRPETRTKKPPMYKVIPVSYTHLTLPTICSV